MAKKKMKKKKVIETLRHDDASRKNIPTAEFESVMRKDELSPVQVAYQRRNRDLDPQLVWRGKDEQDWSDLVVQAPPLYIQEKVHPKILIDDLRKQNDEQNKENEEQVDLFSDFNGQVDPIHEGVGDKYLSCSGIKVPFTWRAMSEGTFYLWVQKVDISPETIYELHGSNLHVYHQASNRVFILKSFVQRLDGSSHRGHTYD